MRPTNFKRLVVNVSVGRAAGGEEATASVSINCTEFLELFRTECRHHIVMTPELSAEWNRIRSVFARTWLKSMVARKRFHYVESALNQALCNKIETSTSRENEVKAMWKDFHLLEAALVTDQTIISLDETVRRCFARAAQSVDEIRRIVWVNPDHTEEEPLVWLQNGAPPDDHRQLRTWTHAQS